MNKRLQCEMSKECTEPVTHLGEKGFIYCTEHASTRQDRERCRKLRAWEVALLADGKQISYKPDTDSRPLFVPLKREWFEAFRDGSKTVEYRLLGPKWNERTCRPGREVVLSLGYSGARMNARVRSFRIVPNPGIDLFPADAKLAEIQLWDIHSGLPHQPRVFGMEYRLSDRHKWRKLSVTCKAPFGAVELEMHRAQLALHHQCRDLQLRMTVDGQPVQS